MPKRRPFKWSQDVGGMPVWAVAVFSVVIVGLFAVPLAVGAPASEPYVRPSDAFDEPTAAPLRAVFIGDSFVEASQVEDAEGFGAIVAAHYGWTFTNLGQGGTGYLKDGPAEFPERQPLSERVAEVVALDPDVVVVAAGLNDSELTGDPAFTPAVDATIGGIREGLPDATIYVVGPFWPTGYPNEGVLAVRDAVAASAAAHGLPFIDPIAGGWITGTRDGTEPGNRVEYIGEDGTHPTAAGQAWIAEQIIAAIG